MQNSSRTFASVVGTVMMVVMTVLLAQWSASHSAPTSESAPAAVIEH
jgi:flagellin-like protein